MAPKLWQMVISIGIIVGAWLVSLVLTKILQKLFAKSPGKRGGRNSFWMLWRQA
ncbi:MAG TPA: hypothetical protein PKI30_00420 [Bacillota bacterium]|nr:hypothetical protein [Bacillota bacterium]